MSRRRQITRNDRTANYRAGQQVHWNGRPELTAELLRTNRPYAQWLVRLEGGRTGWWWESDFKAV